MFFAASAAASLGASPAISIPSPVPSARPHTAYPTSEPRVVQTEPRKKGGSRGPVAPATRRRLALYRSSGVASRTTNPCAAPMEGAAEAGGSTPN